jgi:hypothetical protein
MTDAAATIRSAQKGVLLTEIYPPRTTSPKEPKRQRGRRPAPPTAKRGAGQRSAPRRGRPAAPSRPRIARLDESERRDLIDTFVTLLEGLYTHLPLKKAMYAADPVQRLRLLAQRAGALDDLAFHHELARIFTALRDAHTRYVGPASLGGQVAMLPFLVETYGAPPSARYIVSNVASDRSLIGDDRFVPGVELVWWNGVPIDRAVDLYAENETGGRPDSRRARALETLTLRSLQYGPPPDEHWVVVGYRDTEGGDREVRIPWRVVKPGRARTARAPSAAQARRFAIDPGGEATRRVKKLLFAPQRWLADQRAAGGKPTRRLKRVPQGEWLDTTFQDNLAAKVVDTPSGQFGYLRLWSFDLADDDTYVEEVIRLLQQLPDAGLIIDLRANPGGLIWAAERLLQLFGPQPIAPTRFSLLATPLTRAMAHAPHNDQEFAPWRDSLDDSVATGEPYSQAVPITPPERCNDIGQVYGGPVVAVVDANTYSAGDLFAAGFYDNNLGILVTVGEATGAGGANVWVPQYVEEALVGTEFEQPPLPAGIGYSISVRRATRGTGEADGAAIEDIGVRGHRTYAMTERDLVEGNVDLLAFCGELLATQPATRMHLPPSGPGDRRVEVTTQGLERLDLYVDDRPEGWHDVADGSNPIDLPPSWDSIELRGYANGQLRQRRRLSSAAVR